MLDGYWLVMENKQLAIASLESWWDGTRWVTFCGSPDHIHLDSIEKHGIEFIKRLDLASLSMGETLTKLCSGETSDLSLDDL